MSSVLFIVLCALVAAVYGGKGTLRDALCARLDTTTTSKLEYSHERCTHQLALAP